MRLGTIALVLACFGCSGGGGGGNDSAAGDVAEMEAGNGACVVDREGFLAQEVAPGPGTGAHACAARDEEGRLLIAWADSSGALEFARERAGKFEIEDVLPGDASVDVTWFGRSVGLAPLAGEGVLIAFYDATDLCLKAAFRSTDGDWLLESIDPSPGAGLDVSVAVADDGTVHVVYLDLSMGDLLYAGGTPGAWTLRTIDSDGIVGNDPSLSVRNGIPHVTYYGCGESSPAGCSGELRYAVGNGNEFDVEVVDDGNDTGWYSSLVLDADGDPHVTYCEHSTGRLMYARRAGSAWTTEEADPGPGAGDFSSIALLQDRVYVAYTDTKRGSVRIATRTSPGHWEAFDLDKGGAGSFEMLLTSGECGLACAWRSSAGSLMVAELSGK